MTKVAVRPASLTLSQLTEQLFGERLSMEEAWERIEAVEVVAPNRTLAKTWVGSVGYELHEDSAVFARLIAEAGVERLVDVRELPISRRRGYAKNALRQAMEAAGIEYLHVKALGNPKEFRDLYKSGRVGEGRKAYETFLLAERQDVLAGLAELLVSKRTALMCLEHDPAVCHRSVILEALGTELDLELEIAEIA